MVSIGTNIAQTKAVVLAQNSTNISASSAAATTASTSAQKATVEGYKSELKLAMSMLSSQYITNDQIVKYSVRVLELQSLIDKATEDVAVTTPVTTPVKVPVKVPATAADSDAMPSKPYNIAASESWACRFYKTQFNNALTKLNSSLTDSDKAKNKAALEAVYAKLVDVLPEPEAKTVDEMQARIDALDAKIKGSNQDLKSDYSIDTTNLTDEQKAVIEKRIDATNAKITKAKADKAEMQVKLAIAITTQDAIAGPTAEIASKKEEIHTICSNADGRDLTDEEQANVDKLNSEITDLKAEIAKAPSDAEYAYKTEVAAKKNTADAIRSAATVTTTSLAAIQAATNTSAAAASVATAKNKAIAKGATPQQIEAAVNEAKAAAATAVVEKNKAMAAYIKATAAAKSAAKSAALVSSSSPSYKAAQDALLAAQSGLLAARSAYSSAKDSLASSSKDVATAIAAGAPSVAAVNAELLKAENGSEEASKQETIATTAASEAEAYLKTAQDESKKAQGLNGDFNKKEATAYANNASNAADMAGKRYDTAKAASDAADKAVSVANDAAVAAEQIRLADPAALRTAAIANEARAKALSDANPGNNALWTAYANAQAETAAANTKAAGAEDLVTGPAAAAVAAADAAINSAKKANTALSIANGEWSDAKAAAELALASLKRFD